VVDLIHEFELGIWKAIFRHLVCLLYAAGPGGRLVTELDCRFLLVPTFGRSAIRRFSTNASEMKRLAARNFEDLLQGFYPSLTTRLSRHCYFDWQNGTCSPNCRCTRNQHCLVWNPSRKYWVVNFGAFVMLHTRCSRPQNLTKRLPHVAGSRSRP